MFKSTCCPCRGLKFGSQPLNGVSQASIPPVPRDTAPPSDLRAHQLERAAYTYRQARESYTQNKIMSPQYQKEGRSGALNSRDKPGRSDL